MIRGTIAAGAALLFTTAALAFQVYGAIGAKYRELGGSSSPLGQPVSDEAPAIGGGRFNNFQFGAIYRHPRFGAHAVYGSIGQKWTAAGTVNGFGYPVTDELPAKNGGRYNDFTNNATIIFHPRTGTHAVYGDIRAHWIALGREGGSCGYPVDDEQDYNGGRRQRFSRGVIDWYRPHRVTSSCGAFDGDVQLNPI